MGAATKLLESCALNVYSDGIPVSIYDSSMHYDIVVTGFCR